MKILVIGSGGREHALCWKLAQSRDVDAVYCAPGNPGISQVAITEAIPVDDIEGLLAFARSVKPDLTVVGPELPLSLGVVDAFTSAGFRVFGPVKAAAMLESSKSFAKQVMEEAGVPTASCRIFDRFDLLCDYVRAISGPVVLKADGLAAGKGVFVCQTAEDRESALQSLSSMGDAGSRVVVEDFLTGVEVSYIVATDGERVVPMASSHDYKRLGENDQGPNTGGMGAVSPTPRLGPELEQKVLREVIEPVLAQLRKKGIPFKGFLYAGLMISESGDLKVLEFNVRFGDPETQPILRRMEGDLAALLFALADGKETLPAISWSSQVGVCVVLAAGGYPEKPRKGDQITGLEDADSVPGVIVFHAGTAGGGSEIRTNGGRVLNVTALGSTLEAARERAYEACGRIRFDGMQYRGDIAR